LENIIVILPPPPFTEQDRQSLLENLKDFFNKKNFVFLTRNVSEDIKYYKDFSYYSFWLSINGELSVTEKNNNMSINYDVVVIVQNIFSSIAINEEKFDWFKCEKKYVWQYQTKKFLKLDDFCNLSDKKEYEKNIFNEIVRGTQKSPKEYIFFPYGFYIRSLNDKEVNDFGFRIPDNYQLLAKRNANHKLICIFGGSSAYSVFVKKEKSFSYLLEKKLNQEFNDFKVSVLNFGMPSYVILNEIITYTIFAWELKPDMVISFSGYNDMQHGILTDDYLKKKFNLNYSCWLEGWAYKLRESQYEAPSQWHINKQNSIYPTIKALRERIKQFRDTVEAENTRFIYALQPHWGSKKAHSAEEILSFKSVHQKDPSQPLIETLKFLYNRFKKDAVRNNVKIDIDFDKIFSNFDEKITLFGDICHFVEKGEEIIAEKFFEFIKNKNRI
jgi:hypothetical protein